MIPLTNKTVAADRISGFSGCVYLSSIIPPVVLACDTYHPFKFPWYGHNYRINDNQVEEFIDEPAYKKVTEEIIQYISKNGCKHFEKTLVVVQQKSTDLLNEVNVILQKMRKYNDIKLCEEQHRLFEKYTTAMGIGAITFIYESILSEKLVESISLHLQNQDNVSGIIEQALTNNYQSYMVESENVLLKIAHEKNIERQRKAIKQYMVDYYYILANYQDGEKLTPLKIKKLILFAKQHHKEMIQKEKIIHKPIKYTFTKEEAAMIELLKITEQIRDQRKKINQIGSFVMAQFLYEACKRKKIPYAIARRAFWNEYELLVKQPAMMKKKLMQRIAASTVLDESKKTAYTEYHCIKPRVQDTGILKGIVASRGRVCGKVRIILGPAQFSSFKKGEILVTEMTRPEFLPVMRKAAAILTDEGSLTCHAAIVSREFKIPCIVGLRHATRSLKDGDEVIVDANTGIVTKKV